MICYSILSVYSDYISKIKKKIRNVQINVISFLYGLDKYYAPHISLEGGGGCKSGPE